MARKTGFGETFHPDGRRAAEGCYREGKEVGVWRFWKIEEPSTNFD